MNQTNISNIPPVFRNLIDYRVDDIQPEPVRITESEIKTADDKRLYEHAKAFSKSMAPSGMIQTKRRILAEEIREMISNYDETVRKHIAKRYETVSNNYEHTTGEKIYGMIKACTIGPIAALFRVIEILTPSFFVSIAYLLYNKLVNGESLRDLIKDLFKRPGTFLWIPVTLLITAPADLMNNGYSNLNSYFDTFGKMAFWASVVNAGAAIISWMFSLIMLYADEAVANAGLSHNKKHGREVAHTTTMTPNEAIEKCIQWDIHTIKTLDDILEQRRFYIQTIEAAIKTHNPAQIKYAEEIMEKYPIEWMRSHKELEDMTNPAYKNLIRQDIRLQMGGKQVFEV